MFSTKTFKSHLLPIPAGLLCVLAMPPWNLWAAMFAGLSLLYWDLAQKQTDRSAFSCGWLFGFSYFTGGLFWIGNALLVPGNDFAWAWPLAVIALPSVLAFFPAVACWGTYKAGQAEKLSGFLFFIVFLSLSEWLRGHVFTGFPWNLYGYTWSDTPSLLQLSAIGGPYVLTLLTVFWSAFYGFLSVWSANKTKKIFLGILIYISLFLCIGWGAARVNNYTSAFHDHIAVRALQPAIAQEDKWEKPAENLERLLSLSMPGEGENAKQATLLIWPETAISNDLPLYLKNAGTEIQEMLNTYIGNVFLFTGMLRVLPKTEDKIHNSLVVWDKETNWIATYDKSHLVPFGEYIPFQKYLPFGPLNRFSGFQAGPGPQTQAAGGLPAFSPLVCYEIAFPGAVTDKKGKRPEWLVNVTNDAWYGGGAGPEQHFALAVFRAVEEGIPVVRSANGGISGIIGPLGRIHDKTGAKEAGVAEYKLPRALPELTFYARYGDILFFGAAGLILILAFILRRGWIASPPPE